MKVLVTVEHRHLVGQMVHVVQQHSAGWEMLLYRVADSLQANVGYLMSMLTAKTCDGSVAMVLYLP